MISLTKHKNSTVRIEIINYRMMLEARVGPAYLREAELVLVSKAINVPFIRKAFIFGLRRQLGRCNNMSFYRLFFFTPYISEYKCLLEWIRLFILSHYITSISFLEIELLAGTHTNISSQLFLSICVHKQFQCRGLPQP